MLSNFIFIHKDNEFKCNFSSNILLGMLIHVCSISILIPENVKQVTESHEFFQLPKKHYILRILTVIMKPLQFPQPLPLANMKSSK